MANLAYGATVTAFTTTGTTISVTGLPTTVGTTLIAGICIGGTGITLTAPTGWTYLFTSPANHYAFAFYARTIQAGDASAYTWTSSASTSLVAIVNSVTGPVNVTTPVAGSGIGYASNTQTQTNYSSGPPVVTPALTPTVLGCIPMAFFVNFYLSPGLPAPTMQTPGWTEVALVNPISSGYQATECQVGPLTTDYTTAQQAQLQWGGQFSTLAGVQTILLVQPGVPGALSFTPSSLAIAGPGVSNAATVTVNQQYNDGQPCVLSVPTAFQGIVSVSVGGGAYATSATANFSGGQAGPFSVQELSPGQFTLQANAG